MAGRVNTLPSEGWSSPGDTAIFWAAMEGQERAQTLARRVKRLREAKGWSRERLALEAGLKAKTVTRIEKAETAEPHAETFDSLAAALGVDVYLLDVGRPTLSELESDDGPLRRIERKLDEILARLPERALPAPPGELGRRVAKPRPSGGGRRRKPPRKAAGGSEDTDQ